MVYILDQLLGLTVTHGITQPTYTHTHKKKEINFWICHESQNSAAPFRAAIPLTLVVI